MATDKPQSSYEEILAGIGDLGQYTVYGNEMLIGIYIRPKITAGGIHLTDKTTGEDVYQGKVGFVLAKGPTAFKDDPENRVYFHDQDVEIGQKIIYRISDGFPMEINGVSVRLLQDTEVRMSTTADPRTIY